MILSPKSSLVRGFLPVLTRLVFSSGCIALAVWGKRFCREVMESVAVPGAYPGLTSLAAELSWVLFFGPFALLGLYALARACLMFYRALIGRRQPGAVEILPPLSGAAIEAGDHAAGRYRAYWAVDQPLDDATRRRLDRLAARAVRVSGILVGMILVGLGLAGFLWARTQEYRSLPNRPGFGLTFGVYFPIVCGLFVLVGGYILRETFARPETAWLTPLRVFTAIASKKLTEEEEKKKRV